MKIRSTRKGAARSKRGPQLPILPSTISIRKRQPRVEVADDPVEPFSPNNEETFSDDIDLSQEPREPTVPSLVPPLVQARSLRVSPSIQVIERLGEATLDPHQECHRALCTLRAQVCGLFDNGFLPMCSGGHICTSSRWCVAVTHRTSCSTKLWKPLASCYLLVRNT